MSTTTMKYALMFPDDNCAYIVDSSDDTVLDVMRSISADHGVCWNMAMVAVYPGTDQFGIKFSKVVDLSTRKFLGKFQTLTFTKLN